MKEVFFIAWRYFYTKKRKQIIHYITLISMFGIGISTFALILILSIFNGLESVISEFNQGAGMDIKITPLQGKTFTLSDFPIDIIKNDENIKSYSRFIEETVMLKNKTYFSFLKLKGVDSVYIYSTQLKKYIINGVSNIQLDSITPLLILGYKIAIDLNITSVSTYVPIQIYSPRKKYGYVLNATNIFNIDNILIGGIFSVNMEYDSKYTITSYDYVAKILNLENKVSGIELDVVPNVSNYSIKEKLQNKLGKQYKIETIEEQNKVIFKTSQTEKWFSFIILCFVLFISTFNLIGAMTMLILEKQFDIFTLKSLGLKKQKIFRIFHLQGQFICIIGGLIGLIIGVGVVLIQMYFKVIKSNGLIIDYYPVKLNLSDIIIILITIFSIGFVSAWIPAKISVQKHFTKKKK